MNILLTAVEIGMTIDCRATDKPAGVMTLAVLMVTTSAVSIPGFKFFRARHRYQYSNYMLRNRSSCRHDGGSDDAAAGSASALRPSKGRHRKRYGSQMLRDRSTFRLSSPAHTAASCSKGAVTMSTARSVNNRLSDCKRYQAET